ncbi:MAG: PHP domain-containing protein [Epulopiscium sp.]|nr:PHP domain-containing protein [Candidatus Epulonipiscium sp.]
MKLAYDFHIHTGASPCGDESMTPNNIVNMALLKELDAIAITDHNTTANIKSVLEVARDTSLVIIPGMEVETSEEFHVITLFEDIEQARQLQDIVYDKLPKLKNRRYIFGNQLIYNSQDDIVGEIDRLLLTATMLSVYELVEIVREIGGVCYPAHIDRQSYSIISNLGLIPPDLDIVNLEISRYCQKNSYINKYPSKRIIQSSDAHYLGDILERVSYMEIDKNKPKYWIEKLKRIKNVS